MRFIRKYINTNLNYMQAQFIVALIQQIKNCLVQIWLMHNNANIYVLH